MSSDNSIQEVSISGRPGSASAGTQASSGSTGLALAEARVLCESAGEKSSQGSSTGSAPVKPAAGPAEPDRSTSNSNTKGSAAPFKTAPTGLADPSNSS